MSAWHECVVVGAGPAGLATSRALAERSVDHVVLERHQVGHSWRTQRWDSFRLNTPGWANGMLGGLERDSYATAPEVVARLEDLAARLPVRDHTPVESLDTDGDGYVLRTPGGDLRASTVVLATGNQNVPKLSAIAERIPERVQQMHAAAYRNPAQLPAGACLSSAARNPAARSPRTWLREGAGSSWRPAGVSRFSWRYRGRDTLEWLVDVGFFDQRPEDLEDPAMMRAPQPIVASGGRSLSRSCWPDPV